MNQDFRLSANRLPARPANKAGWPWTETNAAKSRALGTIGRWPRVSVVTPSYNQAEFLEETIQSVLAQGYPNLEYIIIDGGSTDGSVDIIRRYEGQLAYWVSEPDSGQTDALNKGWRRATGEILAWLCSDDIYLPGAIVSSVDYLARRQDVDLVYSSAVKVDEHGRPISRDRPPVFDFDLLLHSCFIPQPTVFIRRRLVERIGLLNPSLHYSLDYEYWLRAASVGNLGRLDRLTAAARYHGDSKSFGHLGRFFSEDVGILDQLARDGRLSNRNPKVVRAAYLRRLLYVVGLSSDCSEMDRRSAVEHLRQIAPPSVRELTNVIVTHDAFLGTPYVISNMGNATLPSEEGSDLLGILPALTAANIIGDGTAAEVRDRLVACATIAAAIRGIGQCRTPRFGRIFQGLARNPDLLTQRGLWVRLARATPWPRAIQSIYQLQRDTVHRLRQLLAH